MVCSTGSARARPAAARIVMCAAIKARNGLAAPDRGMPLRRRRNHQQIEVLKLQCMCHFCRGYFFIGRRHAYAGLLRIFASHRPNLKTSLNINNLSPPSQHQESESNITRGSWPARARIALE